MNATVISWGICACWIFYAFGTNAPKFMAFKNGVRLAMICMNSQQLISSGILMYFLGSTGSQHEGNVWLFTAFYLYQHCGCHFFYHTAVLHFQVSISHLSLIASCKPFCKHCGSQILQQRAYYGIFKAKLDVYLRESLEPATRKIKCPSTWCKGILIILMFTIVIKQ